MVGLGELDSWDWDGFGGGKVGGGEEESSEGGRVIQNMYIVYVLMLMVLLIMRMVGRWVSCVMLLILNKCVRCMIIKRKSRGIKVFMNVRNKNEVK